MKKLSAILLVSILVLSLVACGTPQSNDKTSDQSSTTSNQSDTTESTLPVEGKNYTIGFVAGGLTNPSAKIITEAMQATIDSEYPDVKLIILDGENSIETGLNCIESLIANKVDAFGFSPQDYTSYNNVLQDAIAEGIQVLSCEAEIDSQGLFEYYGCGGDMYLQGYMIGEYYAEVLPKNVEIGHITGNWGNAAQINRDKGFLDALKDKGRDDIKIVAYDTANWDRNEAMVLAEDWLVTYPNMAAIYAIDGSMGLGALQACIAADRSDILLSGCDLLPEAAQEIKNPDNAFDVDIYMDLGEEGEAFVHMLVKMAKGEVPETTEERNDGNCKYFTIRPILITKDNVEQYYKGD